MAKVKKCRVCGKIHNNTVPTWCDECWEQKLILRKSERLLRKMHLALFNKGQPTQSITAELIKNPSIELIKIVKHYKYKNRFRMFYFCKKCGVEHVTPVFGFSFKHNCKSNLSSYEDKVFDFLVSEGLKFKTEYDTVKCINPETGRRLPFDFELIGKKVIIEVQGEQHFQFVPAFHSCEEDLEYQIYKDEIKKDFCCSTGYKLIYLFPEDILSGGFRGIIRRSVK